MSGPAPGPAGGRYVVLGLARGRPRWFLEVGRWATSGALPVDFVRCVSAAEVRARLDGGRAHSCLLVEATLPGLDRDLVARAAQRGCAVVAVEDGPTRRPADQLRHLGVAAVLGAPLSRAGLLAALGQHARPVADLDAPLPGEPTPAGAVAPAPGDRPPGRLVVVTGRGGAGASTLAMALAHALADRSGGRRGVVLADLALHAEQAVLHDVGDVVPGLQELVEAHRSATPGVEAVRAVTTAFDDRGYHLLAGLRRRRHWAALPPRAVEAALDGLRRAFALVVAEVEPDVEGEADGGSLDVEERNHLARAACRRADLIVVALAPTPLGVHGAVWLLDDLLRLGVEPARLVAVVVRAPRPGPARAELARALGALAAAHLAHGRLLASPLFWPAHRRLEAVVRQGTPLPRPWWAPLGQAVAALLARVGPAPPAPAGPEPVVPGWLGVSDP